MKTLISALVLSIAALTAAQPAQAASDFFLRLDGIPGESNDLDRGAACKVDGAAGQRDLAALSQVADKRKPGRLTLRLDCPGTTSAKLHSLAASKRKVDLTAQVPIRQAGQPTCYLKYKLDRCFVKSWSTSGDADDRPTEGTASVNGVLSIEFSAAQSQNSCG